jgi:hypothetical protein
MKAFNLSEGIIVTTSQADSFEEDGKIIRMIPASQYICSP